MSDFPSFSWCEYSFWLVTLAFLGIMEALEAGWRGCDFCELLLASS